MGNVCRAGGVVDFIELLELYIVVNMFNSYHDFLLGAFGMD